MRFAALLILLATACDPAPPAGNIASTGAPTTAAPEPARTIDGAAGEPVPAGAAAGESGPENRFISCPGHPRCPKNQEGD